MSVVCVPTFCADVYTMHFQFIDAHECRYYEDGSIDATLRVDDDILMVEPLHRYSGTVR